MSWEGFRPHEGIKLFQNKYTRARMMATRNTTSPEKRKRMKLADAARYLGISPASVSRLISKGVLKYTVDPLDMRRRLVFVEDLDRLREQSLVSEESEDTR